MAAAGEPVGDATRDLCRILTHLFLAAPRARRGPGQLREVEFLTLGLLEARGTLTVGDIQRHLGVLPAQMSRIVRSLEARPEALISCAINPRDKRKIDVALSDAGYRALRDYQGVRFQALSDRLHQLPLHQQQDVARLLERLRALVLGPPEGARAARPAGGLAQGT